MKRPRISKALLFAIGVVTLLGLIIWSGVETIDQAFLVVSSLSYSSWLLLFFLIVCMMLFHGLRWFVLLIGAGEKVQLRDVYPILFVSYFINQFVPFRPGAPLRGMLGTKKMAVPFSTSILVILIEEIFDVLVTGTLAVRSISILAPSGIFENTQVLVVVTFAAILFLVLLVRWWDGFIRVVTNVLSRLLPQSLRHSLADSNFSISQSIKHKHYLFGGFLLTIAYWVVRFELFNQVLKLVNIHVGFPTAATIISVSFLIGVLSMVPGAWGVKEATITGILVRLGVGRPAAVAAALLDRAVLLLFILIVGGISALLIGTEMQLEEKNNCGIKDDV